MPKELKRSMADEVRGHLEGSDDVLVVGLLPMNAEKTVTLRNTLRQHGARLRVIHNRTSRHALDERRKALGEYFKGPTALALATDPETEMIPVAKVLVEAARLKSVELRGGFVDGELLDSSGFEALARSPDKHTLRGMLAGAIVGPGRGIAASMHAVLSGLARCLRARSEQTETEA